MRRLVATFLIAVMLVAIPIAGAARQSDLPATPMPVIDICADFALAATPEAEAVVEAADATFDLAYVDVQITSHQNAIIMLLIAEPRAEHPELVAFIQQSLADRRSSIETLLGWRAGNYPNAAWVPIDQAMALFDEAARENPGRGGVAGAREIAADPHIEELCADSETPFDLLLIDHLLPQVSGEVLLSDSASGLAADTTLAAIVSDLNQMFRRDLDALYAWRTLWYPDAPEAHSH